MVLTNECAVSRCGNFQMDSVMTTQTSFSYNVVVHGMSLEQCCEKIAKNLKNKCVMHKCIIIVSYIDETMVIAAGLPPLIHQSSSLKERTEKNKNKIILHIFRASWLVLLCLDNNDILSYISPESWDQAKSCCTNLPQ